MLELTEALPHDGPFGLLVEAHGNIFFGNLRDMVSLYKVVILHAIVNALNR